MVLARYDECESHLDPKKCPLAKPKVKLLGQLVLENGKEVDPDKVMAVILLLTSQTTKQLATFV